jgi:rRNA maturation endonuclease Nob1
MTPARLIVWVFDTSSIIAVRRLQNIDKVAIFAGLTTLVDNGRLVYPMEVVEELKRTADPDAPDLQYVWAKENASNATPRAKCSFDEVKEVLAVVSDVLDPNKDSGVEEADPYVLAAAVKLKDDGIDARVVTQETRDLPTKMSISTAAGILGIPSVPLRAVLSVERIV